MAAGIRRTTARKHAELPAQHGSGVGPSKPLTWAKATDRLESRAVW